MPTSPDDPLASMQPYAPPRSVEAPVATATGLVPAERLTRLGAALLDGLIAGGPAALLAIVGGLWLFFQNRTGAPGGPANVAPEGLPVLIVILLLAGLWALGITIFQWYRIATTGQTIGKKYLGIKIVLMDGGPVSFGTGVVVRSIVPGLIGVIPYVGAIFGLVNLLFIFREDRRCIHDHMATTRVVRAPPSPPSP